jgi:hypothetical protein
VLGTFDACLRSLIVGFIWSSYPRTSFRTHLLTFIPSDTLTRPPQLPLCAVMIVFHVAEDYLTSEHTSHAHSVSGRTLLLMSNRTGWLHPSQGGTAIVRMSDGRPGNENRAADANVNKIRL